MKNLVETEWKQKAGLTPGELVSFEYSGDRLLGIVLQRGNSNDVILGCIKTKEGNLRPYYVHTSRDLDFISFGDKWIFIADDSDFRSQGEKSKTTPFFDTIDGIVMAFVPDPTIPGQLSNIFFDLKSNQILNQRKTLAPVNKWSVFVSEEAMHGGVGPIYTSDT